MIRRKRADTYVYRLYCDKCETEMQADGGQLTSNPGRFVHKCPQCGHTESILGKRYPMIDYREIEEHYAESAENPAAN